MRGIWKLLQFSLFLSFSLSLNSLSGFANEKRDYGILWVNNTPWNELRPSIKAALNELLVSIDHGRYELISSEFSHWYRAKYCSSFELGSEDSWSLNSRVPKDCPEKRQVLPEFIYSYEFITRPEMRISLACVISKLVEEFPDIGSLARTLGPIDFVGTDGTIRFSRSQGVGLFKAEIERNSAFTSRSWADHGRIWGKRSVKRGPQLHFEQREERPAKIAVHLDLHNPGDSWFSPAHIFYDQWMREKHYTPLNLVSALPDGCGIGAQDLTELAARESTHGLELVAKVLNQRQANQESALTSSLHDKPNDSAALASAPISNPAFPSGAVF